MIPGRTRNQPSRVHGARGRFAPGPRRAVPVLSAALLSLGGDFASAQTIPSSYRFIERGQSASVFGAYIELPTGALDLGPKSGTIFGGRYAIEAGGPVFFEGLMSFLPTTRDVIDPRRQLGDRAIGEADVHLLMVDARVAFSLTGRRTWKRLAPHLFAGIGVAYDMAGGDQIEDVLLPEDLYRFGLGFTASAGTGARFLLGDRFMVRTDASLKLWQVGTPEGFGAAAKRPTDEMDPLYAPEQSEWVGGYGLSVSLAWRF